MLNLLEDHKPGKKYRAESSAWLLLLKTEHLPYPVALLEKRLIGFLKPWLFWKGPSGNRSFQGHVHSARPFFLARRLSALTSG